MYFSLILLGSLLLSLRVSAQTSCSQAIPINSIVSAPDGILNIDDENGERQIRAAVINTPSCDVQTLKPTGQVLKTNYTILSQAGDDLDSCQIKLIDGVATIDSFQAIVIQTNGFPLNNVSISYQDLDASPRGWKEAGAIFGARDGALVLPTVGLRDSTYLRTTNYFLPADTISTLGLSLGEITVLGAEYAASDINNCPNSNDVETQKCIADVQFSSPIDTIVVLYALVTRGNPASGSTASVSQLQFSCGCRCRESNPGTRTITAAVPGLPGQCVQKETSGTKPECDVLGEQWCNKEDVTGYALTGNTLPNGNLQCEEKADQRLMVQTAFSPDPVFGGTS